MGLRQFWHRNKVLIVMCPSLGLIHWGWYVLNSKPVLRSENDHIPDRIWTKFVSNILNSLSSFAPVAPAAPTAPAAPAAERK